MSRSDLADYPATLLVVDDNDDALDIVRVVFYEHYRDTAGAAFDAFLRKPLNFDDLCRTISTFANRR